MHRTDVAIVGAGVAGLTAAAEAARLGAKVLVIDRMGAGGQVMTVERVDGMPGFADGTAGFELGPQLQERAEAAGAEFMLGEVLGLATEGGAHLLELEGGKVAARAVIVAAGSRRRRLGVPGEEALEGRGVSHCASCDGPLFRGQDVCVVGGGDSAFGEALVLASHAARVKVVFRGDRPHARAALVEEAAARPNIELLPASEVVAITGEGAVTGVAVRGDGGAVRQVAAEGVFVYAGLQADTAFLAGTLQLDGDGRIVTDDSLGTSVPGVFAAGDIRSGADWLLSAAAEDGVAAARAACRFLSE